MIRTILAVLITVALFAVAVPAIDQAAGARGDQQAEATAAEIEHAAKSLYVAEDAPPEGVTGPRRLVSVSLPTDGLTLDPVSSFTIEPVATNHTVIRYSVDGRQTKVVHVEAPLVGPDYGSIEYGQITGEHRFRLTLERHPDEGYPVVVIERL
ncbi:hypothetical protein G9C85_04700 [Halorubellus sp. JP-L1]|uniref:DUF7311 family protein n=1 Tax=Halorubellus sp. JP-L1 TaxID=2715753 RepID=UPI0014094484|nr:hypothetical protein [Halorubellus sp. JP-L1]NHN40935.1 hypothetical protein [Halorubellus sp. JP-L1]